MSIETMQASLKKAGLYSGVIDGDVGKGTLAGLMAYAVGGMIPKKPTAAMVDLGIALAKYRAQYGLNTRLRLIHFLAQIAHESAAFTRFEENLRYDDPARLDAMFANVKGIEHAKRLILAGPEAIANCAYAGRGGNGSEASGDGWRHRGRGPIQITFRAGYAAIAKGTGLDVLNNPDLLLAPDAGMRSALQYWSDRKISTAADANNVSRVTYLINPAMAGLTHRKYYLERLNGIWSA